MAVSLNFNIKKSFFFRKSCERLGRPGQTASSIDMQSELVGHKSGPAQVELKYLQLLQIYKCCSSPPLAVVKSVSTQLPGDSSSEAVRTPGSAGLHGSSWIEIALNLPGRPSRPSRYVVGYYIDRESGRMARVLAVLLKTNKFSQQGVLVLGASLIWCNIPEMTFNKRKPIGMFIARFIYTFVYLPGDPGIKTYP